MSAPRRHVCTPDLPSGGCSLCVAEDGPHTLAQVASHFGVTRERIRQIEVKALEKLARAFERERLGFGDLIGRAPWGEP